jgi:ferredoxin-fold anticodon binding domain-containing protein
MAVVGFAQSWDADTIKKCMEWKDMAAAKKEMPLSIPGVKLISSDELKKWIDTKKDFILLDVRVKEQYDAERIKGAKWMLTDHMLADPKKLDEFKKDATIVVY